MGRGQWGRLGPPFGLHQVNLLLTKIWIQAVVVALYEEGPGKLSRLLGNLGNVPLGDDANQRPLSSTPQNSFFQPLVLTPIVKISAKKNNNMITLIYMTLLSRQIVSLVTNLCHNFLYQN